MFQKYLHKSTKRWNKRFKKILKRAKQETIHLVCIIVCAAGLSIQVSFLIYDYVQYSVSYDEKFDFAYELVIPDIMVCSMFDYVLKYDLLLSERKQLFENICHDEKSCSQNRHIGERFYDRFFNELDMDQAHRYLIRSDEILTSVFIAPYWKYNRLGNGCLALDHIMYPDYCFYVSCREFGIPIKILRGLNGAEFFHEILSLQFNMSSLSKNYNFRVIIQPPENSFTTPNDLGSVVRGNAKGFAKHQFRYKRVFIERLPPPYETRCKHYQIDRQLDECLNSYSINKSRTTFPRRFIHPRKYLGLGLKMLRVDNQNLSTLAADCFYSLRQECKTIRYISSLQSDGSIDDNLEKILMVEILGPVEHDVVVFATPKVTFYTLSILITNLVTAWFGISVLNTVTGVIIFMKKHHTKETASLTKTRFSTSHSKITNHNDRLLIYGLKIDPTIFAVRVRNKKNFTYY